MDARKQQNLQAQLEDVQRKLSKRDEDAKVGELELQLHQLRENADAPPPADMSPAPLAKRSTSSASLAAEESQIVQKQLENQILELKTQIVELQKKSKQELEDQTSLYNTAQVDLTKARTEVKQLQADLQTFTDQVEIRGSSDASHYKERAKLQAEVASLNRKVELLELEKQDLDNNVEDLALDKEQLEEEKEAIEDRLEELKLDAETAQMEVEELRMELEEAKDQATRATTIMQAASGESLTLGEGTSASDEAQDRAQALNVQNARLREALIRLREQTALDKMDISRQLRTAEKEAEENKDMAAQVQELKAKTAELEEQISDLKDMVEQGSAYEVMVEDLSDRVLSLEEELMASQALVREMEEAADITAEMEEVQADELKALGRDLEDRDSVIRNLEEAIKMQRKREDDFQRTVANYRTMMETLKQEKNALLELQQGGEGEKSDLVTASQKALARAAQLVQDAAEMRKREAQAAIDRIDSQILMHLSERLERLLPPSVAAAEIASVKGELLLSKVVGKASLSLDGISRSFGKTIKMRAWDWRGESKGGEEESKAMSFELTDEEQQMAATMIHQSEVAHVAIDMSGDLLWLLSAGQWPDILPPESSAELGAIMGHSMSELDMVLGNVLNTLKEEGVLSPHQSNIGAFRQTVISTMQTLRSHIEHDGESLVPMDWKPPALRLFRDASRAKFSSMGCYAAVASILNHGESLKTGDALAKMQTLTVALRPLLKKLDQASSEASKSCLRLAQLDVQDESTVSEISNVAGAWRGAADELLGSIYKLLMSDEGLGTESLNRCEALADNVLRLVSQFASALRSANLHIVADDKFHPFSPEVADVWEGVTKLARTIRATDGDEDDINYLLRARTIEHALEDAVEKQPKLALANAKVASLEKSLATRSKEIAMQNARLAELEKLLAKTSAQPSPRIISSDMASSEEMNSLKEEIRVLTEAMDVVNRQVEEYESEIRFLKDTKTPQGKRAMRTPRRVISDIGDRRGSNDDLQSLSTSVSTGVFEAALFRPALAAARRDAAQWKAKATISTLLELPPLMVPGSASTSAAGSSSAVQSSPPPSGGAEEEKSSEDFVDPLYQLSSAMSDYRLQAASIKVVDLSNPGGRTPRSHFFETMNRKAAAADRLDKATAAARQWLASNKQDVTIVPQSDLSAQPLVGRVKLAGQDLARTIQTAANPEDLFRLQLHVVR